jgi:hypothetical protein
VNEALNAPVSENGAFKIPNVLASGREYWVFVYGLPPAYYVKSATAGSRDARREPVVPGEGELAISLAQDGATVKGIAIDDEQRPLADVDVALSAARLPAVPYPGFVHTTRTDQNGAFEFRQVEPGDYKLVAISGLLEDEIENPELLQELLPNGTNVTASANGSLSVKATAIGAQQGR